jgi:hypothetical protein
VSVLGENVWKTLWGVGVANGLPEAAISAVITLIVVAAVRQITVGKKRALTFNPLTIYCEAEYPLLGADGANAPVVRSP